MESLNAAPAAAPAKIGKAEFLQWQTNFDNGPPQLINLIEGAATCPAALIAHLLDSDAPSRRRVSLCVGVSLGVDAMSAGRFLLCIRAFP